MLDRADRMHNHSDAKLRRARYRYLWTLLALQVNSGCYKEARQRIIIFSILLQLRNSLRHGPKLVDNAMDWSCRPCSGPDSAHLASSQALWCWGQQH